jgi:excisionase family DNA binding protein
MVGTRTAHKPATGKKTWRSLPGPEGATWLTSAEAAELLRVPSWTLLDLVKRGIVPRGVVARVGHRLRFSRPGLDQWLAAGGSSHDDGRRTGSAGRRAEGVRAR